MALKALNPTEMLQTLSFGLLGPSNKPPAPPAREPLDGAGQTSYNRIVQDAELSSQDIAKQQLAGTDVGQKTFNQGMQTLGNKFSALGGGQGLDQALTNRFNQLYGQNDQRRKQSADLNAPVEQFRRISELNKVMTKQAHANAAASRQNLEFLQQIANQKAALYGQIFSTAGTVGGFMLGGPAGAMAGSQLGQNMAPPQAPVNRSPAYESAAGSWMKDFSSQNRFNDPYARGSMY